MHRVLIIEDHADIRQLIRMTLETEDCEILEAADGTAGVALARAGAPDVVLLDVMMPGPLDGLAVCRQLRADPATAATRIVMLTARGTASDRRDGVAAGADDYLLKPFSPMELLRLVATPPPAAATAPAPDPARP